MGEGEIHDLDLHRRVRHGDREAFDEIYRRYGSAAYGLALRITAQEALAQEVVQDAFLALWRAPEAFDPARGAFRSFFLSLVHHRAVDVVVDGAYLSVRRKEVREALTILPPEQRQVIELAYFGGYTQARIAETLGIPVGTVKTRTLAAMRKMRRVLDRED
jgi:DNA-directed RNA polymerase specialized sigma24 family protein